MRRATMFLTGVATTVATSLSAMAAEQPQATGLVTGINRLNGTIAIQRIQTGTVGANVSGSAEEFKVKDNGVVDDIHAGDRVTFSTSESGGSKIITKLSRQK